MRVPITLAAIFLATAGCATVGAAEDPMCESLRGFADSIEPGEARSIEFRTSWGSNFKDDPNPALRAKRCAHEDYEPARAVCAYLMEHGATEFSGNNVKRALTCLAPMTDFGPDINLNEGSFSIRYGTPDRGSHIDVSFREDSELGGMVLRISADGY